MRCLAVILAVAGGLACDSRPALSGTHASPELLARAVVEAVSSRDASRLRSLALNEQEFRRHIWPSLPAAQPERNLPFRYVWGDLKQKSDLSLRRTLVEHASRRYAFERVSFSGTTDYPGFRVHRNAIFDVRDSSGAALQVRLCGSLVEIAGHWKVFSFVVED